METRGTRFKQEGAEGTEVNRQLCGLADLPLCLFFIVLVSLSFSLPARAASPAETNLFNTAAKQFVDRFYPQAEMSFSNFVATYTNSPLCADAALYQARARIGQSNYAGAIDLLQKRLPASGGLAADYVFWIAEAHFERGEPDDYEAAINGCANLLKHFSASGLRLQAAYYEALAYSKKGNIARTIQLLSDPDGAFSAAARADTNSEHSEFAVSGLLLLSEGYLAQRQYSEGEKVIRQINPQALSADFQWRRQYLLCRLEWAGGQANQALEDSTNLVDMAFGDRRQIDTTFLRAQILEQLNRTVDALEVYTNNLEKRFPADAQRQALVKTIELTLKQNQPQEAQARLQDFIASRPGDAALDAACMLLGELYLKTYAAGAAAREQTNALPQTNTNFLQAAATNLDRVIQEFPQSQFVGKAQLDRGWCDWCQGKIAEAKTNFAEAAQRLPPSEEQATALFKLADAQFEQHDYAAAAANYNLILTQYAGVPSVTNELFDQALYQTVQACVRLDDAQGAQQAAAKLLAWFPNSYFGERGLLLIGEDQNRKYNYAAARATFNELLERFPKTAQLPALRFAIARTYEYEGDSKAALAAYDQWISQFGTDSLLPQVEFSRALALDKAGQETNALTALTNFIVQFPSNSLAPLAQNWIGDYYWNNQDYVNADLAYQHLYQKYPDAGKLAFEARVMAGRAAFARQDYKQARDDFSALVSDTNTPAAVAAEGLFALGDTILEQFHGNNTNSGFLDEAIAVFSKITNSVPTNSLAVLALGRLGDCYLQWADLRSDPNAYTNAGQMYQAMLTLCRPPGAAVEASAGEARAPASLLDGPPQPAGLADGIVDTASRDEAEVGLGLVAERQGLPERALEHYSRVLHAENSDPYWMEQAGVAAARLCEERGRWDQAVDVYYRVVKAVPSLRSSLVKKIAAAQSRADAAKN